MNIHIQIQTIQLLIFTEKFWPLPGFDPVTSPVPSRYATNWAILAWIKVGIIQVAKVPEFEYDYSIPEKYSFKNVKSNWKIKC